MPKKTPEMVREKVVAMRKGGASYSEIEAALDLARPTTIKILREAGLTKGARAVPPPASPSQSVGTPSVKASSVAVASSRGVDEFMPDKKPEKKKGQPVEFQCDQCGTEFVGEEGDELPDECPECGV